MSSREWDLLNIFFWNYYMIFFYTINLITYFVLVSTIKNNNFCFWYLYRWQSFWLVCFSMTAIYLLLDIIYINNLSGNYLITAHTKFTHSICYFWTSVETLFLNTSQNDISGINGYTIFLVNLVLKSHQRECLTFDFISIQTSIQCVGIVLGNRLSF